MRVKMSFTPAFMEGFVKQCLDLGLSCDQTEEQLRKYANNSILARPAVMEGFKEVCRANKELLSKSAMVRYLSADVMAMAEECRIKYGNDILSCQMRQAMGLPEPEEMAKQAGTLGGNMNAFDNMPLQQKMLLGMLAGGGLGALRRTISPTADDQANDRGTFSRFTRGALRGAAIGGGTAAGASGGSTVAGAIAPEMRLPAMMLGAGAGGLAANRLVDAVAAQ